MGNKSKGSKTERELFKMFNKNNHRAVRVAGSGRMDNASCDLIAGNCDDKYCIEVKSTKKPHKYISKEQMEEFIVFSQVFDLKPIIAVRFNRKGWFFLKPDQLEETGKNWKVTLEMAREKGKRFGQAFG